MAELRKIVLTFGVGSFLSIAWGTLPAGAAGTVETTPAARACAQGEIFAAKPAKGTAPDCAKHDMNAEIKDEVLYQNAEALAQEKRYGEALRLVSLSDNRDDPKVLNMMGFLNRKLGRVQVGLGYYREALNIDENFVEARSYMGEAFLQLDQVDKAKEQLAMIEKSAGADAREYTLLAAAIKDFENGGMSEKLWPEN